MLCKLFFLCRRRSYQFAQSSTQEFFQHICPAFTIFSKLDSLIKKITQTAVINIVFQRIFIKLDVSYASQHTFSKVTVTILYIYIYIYIF